jgi:periplasmic divalent cation tolerance protein
MSAEPILVLTSCPDEPVAERIARELIEGGLAACVSRIGPMRSTFRWQGAVQDEPEVLLLIKTLTSRYLDLEVRLKSLHPYEVPEILALPVTAGSREYLSWLSSNVT